MGLHQAFAERLDSAGLADLRLTNHDFKGAVGHMDAVLPHAHFVLADLLGSERDA